MEGVAARHAAEARFVESKIAQLSKPRLGQKPLSPEQVGEASARLRAELASKQSAELAALTDALAVASLAPVAVTDSAQPSSTAPTSAATTSSGADRSDVAPTGAAAAADVDGVGLPAVAGAAMDRSSATSPAMAATALPVAPAVPVRTEPPTVAAASEAGRKPQSRAARRAQKKTAERAADRAADAADAAASGAGSELTPKEAELAQLRTQLAPLGLGMRLVPADGNCLFRAVADQLLLLSAPASHATRAPPPATAAPLPDHAALRLRAAAYIRTHADEFGPFLPYDAGDAFPEGEAAATPAAVSAAVARYCSRLEAPSGAVWGGHPEIRALACTLGVPVAVYTAGAAAPLVLEPTGDEQRRGVGGAATPGGGAPLLPPAAAADAAATLRLSYHTRFYALGEHYNSVVPAAAADAVAGARGDDSGWAMG